MAKLVFTSHLASVAPEDERSYDGETVLEVISQAFDEFPLLKGYVLDDQGQLRRHVCIFLDNVRLPHAEALKKSVGTTSEVYVMQALSGG